MEEEEGEVETKEEEEEEPEKDSESRGSKSKKKGEGIFAEKRQQLFLVEFLVDSVTIDSCAVDEEILEGQTCLTLSFLNFPPMEICEKGFEPGNRGTSANSDKVKFNCGKSLMFAFNEKQCDHPPPLSVEMTVSKKLGEDRTPFKVDIGTIKICVAELFRQIVDIAKFNPDKLPASKSIKDCFMLIGPGKRTMGDVSIYIRLSCLGQNIVTEFQCGSDMKSGPVLFKNREGKKAFEFVGNDVQADDGEMAGQTPRGGGKIGCGCITKPGGGGGGIALHSGGQGDGERTGAALGGGGGGGGGASYAKGNKVILDIPDKNARDGRKMAAGEDCDRKRQKLPTRRINSREEMTVSKVNANPDQNCFILKVGDKGQIPDRGKMILEFRSPKQKMPPKVLPPYHEDIAVQTDSPKKGKGKGKKK